MSQERRRHRHPVGRRGQGQDRRLAHRPHAQGVVRFQGGHNAGHTLVIERPQDRAAPDPVGHPARRGDRASSATASWCRRRRCWRRSTSSSRAGVELDGPSCGSRKPARSSCRTTSRSTRRARRREGDAKIGTTGRGIGPAYEDKVARRAIRAAGSAVPARFAAKLEELLDYHNFVLTQLSARERRRFRRRRSTKRSRWRRVSPPMVTDVPRALNDANRAGPEPAVRGRARRAARRRPRHLSVRDLVQLRRGGGRGGRGRRPAACCTTSSASPRRTRRASASGPFPTELDDDVGERLRVARQRVRRHHRPAAPLRLVRRRGAEALDSDQRRLRPVHHQARRARRHGRAESVRRLQDRRRVRAICSRPARTMPRAASRSTRICPGWNDSTVGAKRTEDLPPNARAYLDRIEAICGVTIAMISTGPDREETIVRRHPFH